MNPMETTMNDLGRLEDLPTDYVDALRRQNLVPLWPSLRALLPPNVPARRTQPTAWSYEALRPLLMRAGELTPMEKAERRVLVLANPGHGLEQMKASPAMYLGMQLLLPGEWAPSHRHTPNAVRMVVEGEGACTTVDGERCPMRRGDLILTPSGQWHEHAHDGAKPVVWLDVLDLPLIHYAEASYAVEGERQAPAAGHGERAYLRGGVVPSPAFERGARSTPMLRYPWADVRAALVALAEDRPSLDVVQVAYVDPETGRDAQSNLGYYALMLRPGQRLRLPVRSPSAVFHIVEGGCEVEVGRTGFALAEADTCCTPGFEPIVLRNRSAREPSFVFIADEAPLHRRLGVYENRG
jgi:gentisate 1,2-dioxygenase